MLLLALESTCDETAAAVVDDSLRVHGAAVATQEELHRKFAGVVPEIAARAHVERVLPTIETALARAGVSLQQIDVISVANAPGLAGSLLVGVTAAKTLAWALGKPLVAINHLHAHVYACRMHAGKNVFPCVGLVVSGGHTSLYRCDGPCEFSHLGGTIDDAAGEAFDKVAALLGLGYPGGPPIAKAAEQGDAEAHRFPRSFARDPTTLDFSFSGLKTAVRYTICSPNDPAPRRTLSAKETADIAASFQAAVVETLVAKSEHALARTGLPTLCVGGGVAANRHLRKQLEAMCRRRNVELWIAPPELCTDNAVMGAVAFERVRAGLFETLELEAQGGLLRAVASGERV